MTEATIAPAAPSQRIASIDWMRGLVMMLMIVDHASMAFDGSHVAKDSARFADAGTVQLLPFEFFTRWITHLCAPTFVLLAGTSLALSIERRMAKGMDAWSIDKSILTRGAIIAMVDLTIISFGSAHWNVGVLVAIGVSMMCMAYLRRLSTTWLLALSLGWIFLGELVTGLVWDPPGSSSAIAALLVANYAEGNLLIHYPIIPWLALMMLGWVFGRHIVNFNSGRSKLEPKRVAAIAGPAALAIFALVRYGQGYGDMFLHRADGSWQQWLHVSKYPPSLTYYMLELGILASALAWLMRIEPKIGVRQNGPFLVFGQTAMFFYIVHRMAMEVPATYFGLRGIGDISTTWIVGIVLFALLYPACRWYRTVKRAHPDSVLQYF